MAHKSDYRNPMVRGRVVTHEEESKQTPMHIQPDSQSHGPKDLGHAATIEENRKKRV